MTTPVEYLKCILYVSVCACLCVCVIYVFRYACFKEINNILLTKIISYNGTKKVDRWKNKYVDGFKVTLLVKQS